MNVFLFVGENPSPLAHQRGATWERGGHCAKTLHAALQACGIDPERQKYLNLFGDEPEPDADPGRMAGRLFWIRHYANHGYRPVALGKKVARVLTDAGIESINVVHPAARGAIRAKERYIEHVRSALERSKA